MKKEDSFLILGLALIVAGTYLAKYAIDRNKPIHLGNNRLFLKVG